MLANGTACLSACVAASKAAKPLVHQKTKKGIILCGADPEKVEWTHYCALVTCQGCRAGIDAIVDAVFTELPTHE